VYIYIQHHVSSLDLTSRHDFNYHHSSIATQNIDNSLSTQSRHYTIHTPSTSSCPPVSLPNLPALLVELVLPRPVLPTLVKLE
jgi:hypothetical protein